MTGDPGPCLAAIDDAITFLVDGIDPDGDDRYRSAILLWAGMLVNYTGSREQAVGELRSVATACQLEALEPVD